MGRDSDWVGAASKTNFDYPYDGYINHDEAYLFVEIFWTDAYLFLVEAYSTYSEELQLGDAHSVK